MPAYVSPACKKMREATGRLRRGCYSLAFSSAYRINSSAADWRGACERVMRGRAKQVTSDACAAGVASRLCLYLMGQLQQRLCRLLVR